MVPEELKVFILALLPVLETRASIPYGVLVAKLSAPEVLAISIIGNILPVPLLLWGLSTLERWALERDGQLRRIIASTYENLILKIRKRGERYIKRYALVGLTLFVAFPIPGSGVWTGSLLAHALGLEPKRAFIAIVVGALVAMLMVFMGTLGVINLT
ncbi:MAG: small multi-drug export protein [Candidatus Nezhaarchaeales archaeon]